MRRQYTNGVDLARPRSQTPRQAPTSRQDTPQALVPMRPRQLKPVRRTWYKRKLIWFGVVVLVIVAGLGSIYATHRPPSLPGNVKSQVKFTTFVPVKLPAGYQINLSSYTYQEGILTFQIKTPSGTILLASEQPQPTNFDISSFYKALKNSHSTTTPYGTVQAGTFLKNKAGSMVALGTWVFISGPPNTDPSQILAVFSALKKAG